jgi:hypothetical protein
VSRSVDAVEDVSAHAVNPAVATRHATQRQNSEHIDAGAEERIGT